jgi:hypothetical protein
LTRRLPVGVFFALFTLSGFAGLIYESIWSHYLKLFLGHAAYAQTLVLAIFMGAWRSAPWLVSRHTERIANLLAGYALAEFGIGRARDRLPHRLRRDHRMGLRQRPALARWPRRGLLQMGARLAPDPAGLRPPGHHLPADERGGAAAVPGNRRARARDALLHQQLRRGAGRARERLLPDRPHRAAGTILTAGILNIVLALTVWVITRGSDAVPLPRTQPTEASAATARSLARAVLAVAFATGAASFMYEITWIRMLTLGLGASTHAFEVMLSAFILGMSLGAFWIRNRIATLRQPVAWLAALLVAKAVFAIYAIWIYGDVLGFIQWAMQATARTDAGYVLITLSGMAASMAVMLPTAICAGISLPLATHVLTSAGQGEASIGRVYGANTAGCILGAAFATHMGHGMARREGPHGAGRAPRRAVSRCSCSWWRCTATSRAACSPALRSRSPSPSSPSGRRRWTCCAWPRAYSATASSTIRRRAR